LVKKQQLLLPKKATAAILPSEVSKNRNILCKSIKKVSKNRNIVVGNLLSKKVSKNRNILCKSINNKV